MSAELAGISLSPAPGEAYYIPVGHVGWGQVEQLPLKQVIDRLKPPLEGTALAKLAHNGKYDMTVLAEYGVAVSNLTFDTMVAAYLLGEKSLPHAPRHIPTSTISLKSFERRRFASDNMDFVSLLLDDPLTSGTLQ